MNAYILTSEYNLYEQQGEYFIAYFHRKPTKDELKPKLETLLDEVDDKTITHVLAGGGRRNWGERWEESWFYLREVESSNEKND